MVINKITFKEAVSIKNNVCTTAFFFPDISFRSVRFHSNVEFPQLDAPYISRKFIPPVKTNFNRQSLFSRPTTLNIFNSHSLPNGSLLNFATQQTLRVSILIILNGFPNLRLNYPQSFSLATVVFLIFLYAT